MKFKAQPMAEPYVIDRVLSCLSSRSHDTSMLDIACGQGYIVERLSIQGFFNLHAADISSKNFKLNKKQFHFYFPLHHRKRNNQLPRNGGSNRSTFQRWRYSLKHRK